MPVHRLMSMYGKELRKPVRYLTTRIRLKTWRGARAGARVPAKFLASVSRVYLLGDRGWLVEFMCLKWWFAPCVRLEVVGGSQLVMRRGAQPAHLVAYG
jgi:hypothetical protein